MFTANSASSVALSLCQTQTPTRFERYHYLMYPQESPNAVSGRVVESALPNIWRAGAIAIAQGV